MRLHQPLYLVAVIGFAGAFWTCTGHDSVGQPQPGPRRPLIVAHRGLFKHAPENTLAAFGACRSLRCGFELDVRRTKDGRLVCMHDADVGRTTNGKGKVADLTLAELRTLDAGAWFDPIFRGERVPTLDEVFTLLGQQNATEALVALDIKVDDDTIAADIATLAGKHAVTRHLVCIGNTITTASLRRRLRAASKQIGVAVLTPRAEDLAATLEDRDADWVYLRFIPTTEQAAQIHAAGKRIFLSGPLVAGNEPDHWRRSLAVHVDALLTDYPLACRATWRETK